MLGEQLFNARYGKPFTAIVAPTALYQAKAVPYTLLYQPPGDQSTVSFPAASTYGATYTINSSSENATNATTDQSTSSKFSESLAFLASFGAGLSSSWDQTTKQGIGTTATSTGTGASSSTRQFTWTIPASPTQIPGSGDVCASATSCGTVTKNADSFANEPFWLDTFILLVHPQYAYWQFSASDQTT